MRLASIVTNTGTECSRSRVGATRATLDWRGLPLGFAFTAVEVCCNLEAIRFASMIIADIVGKPRSGDVPLLAQKRNISQSLVPETARRSNASSRQQAQHVAPHYLSKLIYVQASAEQGAGKAWPLPVIVHDRPVRIIHVGPDTDMIDAEAIDHVADCIDIIFKAVLIESSWDRPDQASPVSDHASVFKSNQSGMLLIRPFQIRMRQYHRTCRNPRYGRAGSKAGM